MAITDSDRAALGDLAMRAIDAIIGDYGEDATLVAGCLVFEIEVGDGEDVVYHGNYRSTHASPHHIGGLLSATALHILGPESDA